MHRADGYEAASNYLAMFRGEETDDAIAAAIRFHELVELGISYIRALAKAGR